VKIAFIGHPASGHLNPMTALARRVQSRGHEVVFIIGVPDTEPVVRASGLTFVPYCEEEFPAGSLAEGYAPIAKIHGFELDLCWIMDDPDLCAEKAGEDFGTVVGIGIILLTALTSALTYIYLYMRTL
jgi:hypothetical protein